ncbi:TetR/AcrR family transcriptional regulator [Kineococcus gynurae]|uniref:TetR/AcrR family transcriptional regulator n=1 Tax=Kineococcus gynurae TaxID=452979 RepID=A0ABV5LT96_9ACTN
MSLLRPTREQIQSEIVDTAARLFARHGFEQTSLQRVADAVGYSKAGLLHHFPTKESLQEAAIDSCLHLVDDLRERAEGLPVGVGRDRALLEGVVDLAQARTGLVSLLITSGVAAEAPSERVQAVFDGLVRSFDPTLEHEPDPGRLVRLTVALGGIALTVVACREDPAITPEVLAPQLLAAAVGALGHPTV